MVKREYDFPRRGELVVGTVTEINPNSIFVKLDEYDKTGMVHISEVAKKWVRDIRNWAKEGEKTVCKVKGVDKDRDRIDLSLKKVDDREKNKRMQTWKRDQRGNSFLETVAERADIDKEEIDKEIGFFLQENFKDLLEPFEIAVKKGVEELKKRDVEEKWAEIIKEVAEEKIKIKTEKISKKISLKSLKPDGIERIKKVLSEIEEEFGLEVKYISAPEYEFSIEAKDPKQGQKKLEEAEAELRKKEDITVVSPEQ
ncbi:MAG: S1 RNA-binding domain-containing protein [Candidatus Aenigmatarchaeota archaeon]